jgi:pilus assembly protein Flp/PilA
MSPEQLKARRAPQPSGRKEAQDRMEAMRHLYFRAFELARRGRERAQAGQGMVEYALILVLIAVVVIVIIQLVGKQVNNVFSNISNGLGH